MDKVEERPGLKLEAIAYSAEIPEVDSPEFASYMDSVDPLAKFRQSFDFPVRKNFPHPTGMEYEELEEPFVYMSGNSLGLRPKKAETYLQTVMEEWKVKSLHCHFEGFMPAALCDKPGKKFMAELVGALPDEITIMNSLTINLHLMLQAFYRPTMTRYKILIEWDAFPSDRYAVRSVVELNELSAAKGGSKEAVVMLKPRPGETLIRHEDIIAKIEEEGDSLCCILFPGINYLTGQVFDMAAITKAGHDVGAKVGFDLAHAVGNIKLHLHEWGVDFAAWCTYKYLNSGPGCIGGAFLHDRFADNPPLHLLGWWSNCEKTRFQMRDDIDMARGCDSFRLANPPPFLTAINFASLEIFHEAGMDRIIQKQFLLTGFLEYLIIKRFCEQKNGRKSLVQIITPDDPTQRGSQLSLQFDGRNLKNLHSQFLEMGVMCDVRSNIIRVAPAPLYNSFQDVYKLVQIMEDLVRLSPTT